MMGNNILWVDDELGSYLLDRFSYLQSSSLELNLDPALTLGSCINRLKEKKYDLIILDLLIPSGSLSMGISEGQKFEEFPTSGLKFGQRLRNKAFPDIRIENWETPILFFSHEQINRVGHFVEKINSSYFLSKSSVRSNLDFEKFVMSCMKSNN